MTFTVTKEKVFAAAAIAAAIVFLSLLGIVAQRPTVTQGSVAVGNDYIATTTESTDANASWNFITDRTATLGSVVIASTSVTTFTIKDATSTTDLQGKTVVVFNGSPALGTYTFDIQMKRGIVLTVPSGFNGQYVVTGRPQAQ